MHTHALSISLPLFLYLSLSRVHTHTHARTHARVHSISVLLSHSLSFSLILSLASTLPPLPAFLRHEPLPHFAQTYSDAVTDPMSWSVIEGRLQQSRAAVQDGRVPLDGGIYGVYCGTERERRNGSGVRTNRQVRQQQRVEGSVFRVAFLSHRCSPRTITLFSVLVPSPCSINVYTMLLSLPPSLSSPLSLSLSFSLPARARSTHQKLPRRRPSRLCELPRVQQARADLVHVRG